MAYKRIFRIILIFCLMTGYFCNTIEFCSGKSIKDYFDDSSKGSALVMDGSSSAVSVVPTKTGKLSCTCVVTPYSSVPDILRVSLVYSSKSADIQTCYKNIEVRKDDTELEHVFGCSSDNFELQDLNADEGIRFSLNLFGNSEKVVDSYHLYIAPEPGTILAVQCYSPIQTISSTTVGNFTDMSLTSTTTASAFVTAESENTMIVVGVVVGLGLLFLIFITCMLCYIARPKLRHDSAEKPNSPEHQEAVHHNIVSRKLTNFYDKVKANRPLPSLPSSFRNLARWKTRNQNGSGVYDSIKSHNKHNNNAKYTINKQVSHTSDCSYLEPVAITTISETVTKRNMNSVNLTKYVETGTTQRAAPAEHKIMLNGIEHEDSIENSYIHPVSGPERNTDTIGQLDSHNTNENIPTKPMYVNGQVREATDNDAKIPDLNRTKKENTGMELSGSGYMVMGTCDNNHDRQNEGAERDMGLTGSSKEMLDGTDSSGYLSMNSVDTTGTKSALEQNDSLFPELIKFTPHDFDVNEACLAEDGRGVSSEVRVESKTGKTKRYVRNTED